MMTICLMLVGTGCQADNAVKNSDFAQASARGEEAPADWLMPEEGLWSRAPEGPGGQMCLFYDGEVAVSGPVRQRIEFIEPGITWELRAKLKASSGIQPRLSVRDADGVTELGQANANVSGLWHTVGLRFEPPNADIVIEIYADGPQYDGEAGRAGNVRVTEVELVQVEAGGEQQIPDLGENIALGAAYTASPGNYGLTKDAGDKVQLTDGEYSEGYFWAQASTVGWTKTGPQFVQIDLGQDMPVSGVSFSSAAGIAGVTWPGRILISVSQDGENWYGVGDLRKMAEAREPLPVYGTYNVYRIWTDQLQTHGRYVGLAFEPDGPYTFCDEIEVYRGEEAWVAQAYQGEAITNPGNYLSQLVICELVQQQFLLDLQAVREDIAELADGRDAMVKRADALGAAIEAMPPIDMDGFRAVLPMTELEADVFRLQAEVWRAQEKPALRAWHQHRWDSLAPSAEPADDSAPALSVQMMSNEYRADVLNLTNASADPMTVTLNVTGLPAGADEFIALHQVEHVGTRHFTSVASAMPEVARQGDGWSVEVPAGMTRQVWIAVNRPDLAAGEYAGEMQLSGQSFAAQSVPLSLRIWPLRMPDEMTLMVGGWSYTNTNAYGMTEENADAVIAHLIEYQVNAPWANSAALAQGSYDAEGNMTEEPTTDNFDAWLADWPDSKMYMVFMGTNPNSTFAGAERGSEKFATALGNWASFWAEHMKDMGLEPSQLAILTVDEPHNQDQYDTIVDWATAIKAADSGILIWEDPTANDPEGLGPVYEISDVLCPNRRLNLERPAWYLDQVFEAQAQGKQIWLYSCSGPARSFDPYSYYLVQAWDAFRIGAKASCFWCFTDTGGVSCWNEYPAGGAGPYCPSYIDDTSVTTSKYMEAIREGSQDYEYMTMLAARVAELEAAGTPAGKLAKARALLANGADRVLASEDGANWRWDEVKDRAAQDRVRVEVLEALVALQ